ncbi:hypothetical protein COO91_03646 [Nostoc flagelliforme CCNUN1]|uniref:Uncharacterized protein n=1 Tax=Nostoc flagelliforme CCNUN1 TaxID=2038116 RepID=A0A2K8SQF8_9NOSO|nr:hypothetical protein COO91_03646 [Nostoc flagelliforme CCNUN1]
MSLLSYKVKKELQVAKFFSEIVRWAWGIGHPFGFAQGKWAFGIAYFFLISPTPHSLLPLPLTH